MRDVNRTEVVFDHANRVIELTPDDEIFLISALKIAATVYGEKMAYAFDNEGKSVFDREVEILRRFRDEYGSRAGLLGMSMESDTYERYGRVAHDHVSRLVDDGVHFTGALHYPDTPATA